MDRNFGFVENEKVTVFAGTALVEDWEAFSKEFSKTLYFGNSKFRVSCDLDPNPIADNLANTQGPYRIVTIFLLILAVGVTFYNSELLYQYILMIRDKRRSKNINYFFVVSLAVSLLANCVRVLVFLDPTSLFNIFNIGYIRVFFTFHGCLHILSTIMAIFGR